MITGPITTREISKQKLQLTHAARQLGEKSDHFAYQRESLNLQKNSVGLNEFRGSIQGHYPLFIARESLLADKITQDVYLRTIHGGVGMTMTEVRQHNCIPKFHSLVKKMRKSYYSCKRFQ